MPSDKAGNLAGSSTGSSAFEAPRNMKDAAAVAASCRINRRGVASLLNSSIMKFLRIMNIITGPARLCP
jgi:hypothetical protein